MHLLVALMCALACSVLHGCHMQVYLKVVGEQGARLSPLMRDLLVSNKHTCQVEVVPMEPGLR